MTATEIRPAKGLHIDQSLPGDKSISHRAVIVASIAEGDSVIKNLSNGADVASTVQCIRQLGVDISFSGTAISIAGRGLTGLRKPDRVLDCRNSGTTARLLAGILAGQKFDTLLTGDLSLSRRPMKRIANPLRQMGASISLSVHNNLPMAIAGSTLRGISYSMEVPSAQVKSCILLAGLYAEGDTCVIERRPTRDHTERMISAIRNMERHDGHLLTVRGGTGLSPLNMTIPGDISSAAFLIAAGLLIPDSNVVLRGIGLNPTRTGFLEALKKMNANIIIKNANAGAPEPFGDIFVLSQKQKLSGGRFDGSLIPNIIDEIPILAVLGTQTESGIEIRGASELRHKECDRIAAIVYNLHQLGARVTEYDDGFFVHPSELGSCAIKSFGDHRIAMAFTVAALAGKDTSVLDDPECVAISFPDFFDCLNIKTHKRQHRVPVC